jgi:hypothetical protein
MRYSCVITLEGEFSPSLSGLEKVLDCLDFRPAEMDVFFNEFVLPKENILFDKEYLLENLSQKEMEGISTFSLYDEHSTLEKVTPFFRFRIDHINNGEKVRSTLEWVSYAHIPEYVMLESDLLTSLLKHLDLCYCYYYNQNDVGKHVNMEARESIGWGKRVRVKGFDFIAAPLMYFGRQCDEAIPFELISKFPNTERLQIQDKDILKVSLFDIHDSPDKHRSMQEKFWRVLNLENLIERYREKTKIDFLAFMQKRAAMHKKRK